MLDEDAEPDVPAEPDVDVPDVDVPDVDEDAEPDVPDVPDVDDYLALYSVPSLFVSKT